MALCNWIKGVSCDKYIYHTDQKYMYHTDQNAEQRMDFSYAPVNGTTQCIVLTKRPNTGGTQSRVLHPGNVSVSPFF